MTRFNLKSYFGEFGGAYVPEILTPVLHELESTFITAKHDSLFQKELNDLLKKYVGRPTPLTLCRNITYGTHTKLYLKREDLSHGGAHKINQALGQALLAKKMKKHNIIAETGAGQHGIAVAIASSLLKLKCRIYMGDKDIQRQKENVFRIKLMGSEIISINKNGTATLKDACNAAIRDWSKTYKNTHYILGTAAGPHPFPTIVREFQSVIGQETYEQIQSEEHCLPNAVIACVGGGSNAIGIFSSFINHPSVQLIGVEAGGLGIDTDKHSSAIQCGSPGIYFGMKSHLMQSHNGQIIKNSHSIASGLDFPSVGPEHTYLYKTKRVQYVSITDKEAITAFKRLSKYEGIIPALESSHAIAYALKIIRMKPNTQQILIVNLSGRGDKDISTIRKNIETKQDKTNDDTISEII